MSDVPPRLPQSLYDALKKGEEVGSNMPPEFRKRFERALKNIARLKSDPDYRARFSKVLDAVSEQFTESQRQIAELNGTPQKYSVVESFTHATAERYIDRHHLISPEKSAIRYAVGTTPTLWPILLHGNAEGRTISFWAWMDIEGWIIRPGVLDWYLKKGLLRKTNA